MEKPQYTLSYNDITKNPNWASWRLNRTWLGLGLNTERTNLFEEDRTLPNHWQRVRGSDDINRDPDLDPPVSEGGQQWRATDDRLYDRGHMTPSGDRGRNHKDNFATFLMTNMVPQNENNNREFLWWRGLETFSRNLVQNDRELYIIAGGRGTQAEILSPNDFWINVPEHLWKVILVLDRPGQGVEDITENTMAFAVDMPNINPTDDDPRPTSWRDYVIPVRQLENLLAEQSLPENYDFLSNIPTDLQNTIENRRRQDIINWIDSVQA